MIELFILLSKRTVNLYDVTECNHSATVVIKAIWSYDMYGW